MAQGTTKARSVESLLGRANDLLLRAKDEPDPAAKAEMISDGRKALRKAAKDYKHLASKLGEAVDRIRSVDRGKADAVSIMEWVLDGAKGYHEGVDRLLDLLVLHMTEQSQAVDGEQLLRIIERLEEFAVASRKEELKPAKRALKQSLRDGNVDGAIDEALEKIRINSLFFTANEHAVAFELGRGRKAEEQSADGHDRP